MEINKIIDTIYLIPESSKLKLIDKISEISYPKGHLLLKSDSIETKIYFIKKGIVRAYVTTPENEVTFWFGKEGETVISMKNYVESNKSYESIELLEDCHFYEINIAELQQLFDKDIHIANWGRKFAERELIKTEERLIQLQFKTATERYTDLLSNYPELLQRVQLGYIASYLGMTQVSLSRIRSEVKF